MKLVSKHFKGRFFKVLYLLILFIGSINLLIEMGLTQSDAFTFTFVFAVAICLGAMVDAFSFRDKDSRTVDYVINEANKLKATCGIDYVTDDPSRTSKLLANELTMKAKEPVAELKKAEIQQRIEEILKSREP